ncbi:MAG: Lrp/AsnC family transcriptional regulator [Pseudonocardia sp.]|nr:Lrp/AsnC family transcriptional regulator [Pseudonocardia sp.]
MIVEMLRAQARTEVHELASRVGLPCERVRARLRRLERSGFIRGYHARTSALVPTPPEVTVLAFVRFTGPDRPTALAIGGIAGVVRVHSLCSGWDYMVEAGESLFAATVAEGSVELLGCSAVIQVLAVTDVQRGGRGAHGRPAVTRHATDRTGLGPGQQWSGPDGFGQGNVAGCRTGPRG